MSKMRAKMLVQSVAVNEGTSEVLTMTAVGPTGAYPADGSDEDNSYAKWSPQASLSITIANPALWGKFKVGEKYYVDFTEAKG